MSADFDRTQLFTWFGALQDGAISAEDHARLERLLAQHPEARRLWFLHCDIETGAAEWAAARGADHSPARVIIRPSAFRRAQSWLLPLAAVLAVLVAVLWWRTQSSELASLPPETPATGVGVLARAVDAEWIGQPHQPGEVLPPGTLHLKSGLALVEFLDGARVILQGPVEFRLVSPGEAFLQSGKISAHVPPQARGFTVGSSDVKVVDHGTDFGFEVSPGGAPVVHVFTGDVEVIAPQSAPVSLQAGQAARFENATPVRFPAARSQFLTEDELAARSSEHARTRRATWDSARRNLDAEAHTLVHFTFDESDAVANRLTNRSAASAPDSFGTIIGSRWTEGRWSGKRALEFRGEGDRVRFIAPQLISTLTLVAWVRVNALPRWHHVLMASGSDRPGAVQWHLTQKGELRLEIARDLGRSQADWEAVNSAPFVTPDRFGQWLMLATTFDGQTIRHYANGQPIGQGASFTPPSLAIGPAELGNWRGKTQRQLAATLDEFALLSRPLTPQEIAALYETGKP